MCQISGSSLSAKRGTAKSRRSALRRGRMRDAVRRWDGRFLAGQAGEAPLAATALGLRVDSAAMASEARLASAAPEASRFYARGVVSVQRGVCAICTETCKETGSTRYRCVYSSVRESAAPTRRVSEGRPRLRVGLVQRTPARRLSIPKAPTKTALECYLVRSARRSTAVTSFHTASHSLRSAADTFSSALGSRSAARSGSTCQCLKLLRTRRSE